MDVEILDEGKQLPYLRQVPTAYLSYARHIVRATENENLTKVVSDSRPARSSTASRNIASPLNKFSLLQPTLSQPLLPSVLTERAALVSQGLP